MSEYGPVPGEDDLHAYVDGRLDPARRAQVVARLRVDADAAARVEAYRRQNQALHGLFDPVLDDPLPGPVRASLSGARRRTWSAARAAAVAWFVLAPLVGWFGREWFVDEPAAQVTVLPRDAVLAHAVYTPEVLHPVEVDAEREEHLVQWLSKRLQTPLRVPDFGAFGYGLMGGRLLPGADGPAAQFMYQDAQGTRLTLYVSVRQADTGQTAFRFTEQDGVTVLYWIDGRLGYALSGPLTRSYLLTIAEAAYHQLGL